MTAAMWASTCTPPQSPPAMAAAATDPSLQLLGSQVTLSKSMCVSSNGSEEETIHCRHGGGGRSVDEAAGANKSETGCATRGAYALCARCGSSRSRCCVHEIRVHEITRCMRIRRERSAVQQKSLPLPPSPVSPFPLPLPLCSGAQRLSRQQRSQPRTGLRRCGRRQRR